MSWQPVPSYFDRIHPARRPSWRRRCRGISVESEEWDLDLRRSLGWALGQQATQFALGVVGSIIIARLLTPAEVGVFALAMSVSYLLGALRGAGVGLYLVREPNLDEAKIRTAFGMMIIASWLSGLILLLLAGPMARIYGEPAMVPVMGLLSVAFFIAPFGEPALSLLTREMRFDILYRVALLSTLAGTMTSVSLAASGFSYYALACGLIASSVTSALLALIHEPRHLRLQAVAQEVARGVAVRWPDQWGQPRSNRG